MILVLLGTQNFKFERLIKYVIDYGFDNNITDNIIIQTGANKYDDMDIKNLNIKFVPYLDNYDEDINKAKVIIAHGGVGIIMDSLYRHKKVIAIPREKKYNEHINNHQREIVDSLYTQGYIEKAINYEEFSTALLNINNKELKEYKSNTEVFNNKLNELIENIIGDK